MGVGFQRASGVITTFILCFTSLVPLFVSSDADMIGVGPNLEGIKEDELCWLGGAQIAEMSDDKQSHVSQQPGLCYRQQAAQNADLVSWRWHLIFPSIMLISSCPPQFSQNAAHAGCHCGDRCLNKLAGCDVRGTGARREELELIGDPCLPL